MCDIDPCDREPENTVYMDLGEGRGPKKLCGPCTKAFYAGKDAKEAETEAY